MALVVESTSFTNWSSSEVNTIDVTKPTGLVVGELMVAHVTAAENSGPAVALPTGWTNISTASGNGGDVSTRTMYKIAQAGDVAASDFTFTSSVNASMSGGMYRISGAPPQSTIQDFDNSAMQSLSSNLLMNTTILLEPVVPNSLFITFYTLFFLDGATRSLGVYSSTPSITRTEAWDNHRLYGSGDFNPLSASVYGVYSGSSDITEISASLSSADTFSFFSTSILINPQQNAATDVSHLDSIPTVNGLVGSNNVAADVPHLAVEPTINGLSSKKTPTPWRNPDKPTTNWNNLPK
jgi:hypothetical protein